MLTAASIRQAAADSTSSTGSTGSTGYIGRFAPSPTGALHAGSLVAALASWLDARAHGGRWLVRIEDVDTPRCIAGAEAGIVAQLARCGLVPDATPLLRQSDRGPAYEAALRRLLACGWAYACGCSRKDIEQAAAAQHGALPRHHAELPYPGTCRDGMHGRPARAARLLAASANTAPWTALEIDWSDRRLGAQRQNVSESVGDFVLRRADGLWAYQLAVVVDDAAQGVTHVVRGADLADNTPRQIHLQRLLGLPTPVYLHTPLVLGADGAKLSKQNGALPLDPADPLAALRAAGRVLDLECSGATVSSWLDQATTQWRARWPA